MRANLVDEKNAMLRLFQPDSSPPADDSSTRFPAQWQSADVLAFSGDSTISLGIKIGSCSPISHVAAIGWTPKWQLRSLAATGVLRIAEERVRNWCDQPLLYESTTIADMPCEITGQCIQGVQAHRPIQRIQSYQGRVWLYRLTPAWQRDLSEQRQTRLTGHLLARIGQQYDGRGAILSGTRVIKHFWAWRRVDRSSLFCSEYLASVLQHVGLFPITNASKVTPGGLIKRLVEAEVYSPGLLLKA